jgi:hypothetical protein
MLISTWNLLQSKVLEKKIWLSLGQPEVFLRLPPPAGHKHLLTKTSLLKSIRRTRSGPLTSQFSIKSALTWKILQSEIVWTSVPQSLWTSLWHCCPPRVGGKINLAMLQALSCLLRRHRSAYKSQTRWRYGTWEIRATSLGSSPWTSRILIRKMGPYLIRLYLWAPLSSKIKRIFTTCQMSSGPC